jgi:hypothetical protein
MQIMGTAYDALTSQWSKGDYPAANNVSVSGVAGTHASVNSNNSVLHRQRHKIHVPGRV